MMSLRSDCHNMEVKTVLAPGDVSRPHSVTRQSSVYSLTLDEFQNTICQPGKNFGSMNMDEFLMNIWNAEESQALATAMESAQSKQDGAKSEGKTPTNQLSILHRQGSITLPAPLCRKTVDEVWSEIHRDQQSQTHPINLATDRSSENASRQPTFGEMTLEDFLIKAGVVRQGFPHGPSSSDSHQQRYGLFQPNNFETDFTVGGERPVYGNGMGFGYRGSTSNGVPDSVPGYQGYHRQPGMLIGEGSSSNGKRSGGFPGVNYCGRILNGAGAFPGNFGEPHQPVEKGTVGSPVSPISEDELGPIENSVVQLEVVRGNGRKRIIDGPVEHVVERRQIRMIKNRESAARSRARKQAYTVELEAELNQLKEENAHIRREMEEEEAKRRRKFVATFKAKLMVARRTGKRLRRAKSCPK